MRAPGGNARARAIRKPCEEALEALTAPRETGDGNLLDLAVQAARAARHAGRNLHRAGKGVRAATRPSRRTISGVYSAESQGDPRIPEGPRRWRRNSPRAEGRRPRILVAKMGQDGHDRGAKVIATAFADLGFDVDVGPLFQTPREAARMAVENDVHVLGVSIAGGRP